MDDNLDDLLKQSYQESETAGEGDLINSSFDKENEEFEKIVLNMEEEVTPEIDFDEASADKNSDEIILKDETQKVSFFKKNIYYIVAGILTLMIIGVGAGIIVVKNKIGEKVKENAIEISLPANVLNNANFIFINKAFRISDQIIEIKKILMDDRYTIIYFNNEIDLSRYRVGILDQDNNIYLPDISFVDNERVKSLHFAAFGKDIKSFDLFAKDIESGEEIHIPFKLKKKSVLAQSVVFDEPQNIFLSDTENIGILDKVNFSSAGTSLYFDSTYKNKDNSIFLDTENGSIEIKENALRLVEQREKPLQFAFEDNKLMLYRMDFEPLRSLDSKVYIKFNNIFKQYGIHKEIDPSNLFSNRKESELRFSLEDFTVVLEAMGLGKNNAILVMHAENNYSFGNSVNANDEYSNRKEVRADIDLIFENADGSVIETKGEVLSAEYGTDIVFDLSKIENTFGNSNLKLRINSFSIRKESQEIEINLKDYKKHNVDSANEEIIKNALIERLKYKSNLISSSEINNFNKELLERNISGDYKPVAGAENMLFGADVLISKKLGDKYFVVAADNWHGSVNGKYEEFSAIHKIVAEIKNDGILEIIKDDFSGL